VITLWTRAAEVAHVVTTHPSTTPGRSFLALINVLEKKENVLNAILEIC